MTAPDLQHVDTLAGLAQATNQAEHFDSLEKRSVDAL
jgi:hypothetical protein